MAEAGSQEWIDESLAQLEVLESKRDDLAGSGGDAQDIASLDAEIAQLYEELESVSEDEPEPELEPEPEPEPEPAAEFNEDPFGGPDPSGAPGPSAAPSDAAVPSANLGGFGDMNSAELAMDDYGSKGGGAMKWVIMALLAGAGVGGFMWWQGQQDAVSMEADVAKDTGPGKVVQAITVPEDTEDLKTAKGQDVDRLPGAEFKKSKRRGGGGGGGSGSSRRPKADKGRDSKIKLTDSDDPLG